MLFIFSASSDSFSFQHSSRFLGPLLRTLFPSLSDASVHHTIFVVRKSAHVGEYAVLYWLVWRALRPTTATGWSWGRAALALAVVLLYAVTDEWHQAFVPSRDGTLRDVLFDTGGGVLALLFIWSLGRCRKRW
jgi:VanZ family protein